MDADELSALGMLLEEDVGEGANDYLLDLSLERTCAVSGIKAGRGDPLDHLVVDFDPQSAAGHTLALEQALEVESSYSTDGFCAQGPEDDDATDSVEEFGSEELLRFLEVAPVGRSRLAVPRDEAERGRTGSR